MLVLSVLPSMPLFIQRKDGATHIQGGSSLQRCLLDDSKSSQTDNED